jgi:hypothetical protein
MIFDEDKTCEVFKTSQVLKYYPAGFYCLNENE